MKYSLVCIYQEKKSPPNTTVWNRRKNGVNRMGIGLEWKKGAFYVEIEINGKEVQSEEGSGTKCSKSVNTKGCQRNQKENKSKS